MEELVSLTVEVVNDEVDLCTELCDATSLVNTETTKERVRDERGCSDNHGPGKGEPIVLTDDVLDVGELPPAVPDGVVPT